MNQVAMNDSKISLHEPRTVLQYHLKNKTICPKVIQNTLQLSRSTIHKWSVGELFPQRPNAAQLIEMFGDHDVFLDYNDIYRIKKVI